ncbi:uncharacterized protein LOC143223379 isoform X2 [Tachypleus tridentatus]
MLANNVRFLLIKLLISMLLSVDCAPPQHSLFRSVQKTLTATVMSPEDNQLNKTHHDTSLGYNLNRTGLNDMATVSNQTILNEMLMEPSEIKQNVTNITIYDEKWNGDATANSDIFFVKVQPTFATYKNLSILSENTTSQIHLPKEADENSKEIDTFNQDQRKKIVTRQVTETMTHGYSEKLHHISDSKSTEQSHEPATKENNTTDSDKVSAVPYSSIETLGYNGNIEVIKEQTDGSNNEQTLPVPLWLNNTSKQNNVTEKTNDSEKLKR